MLRPRVFARSGLPSTGALAYGARLASILGWSRVGTMTQHPSSRRRSIAWFTHRAWWALLIVVHLPALASVGRSILAHAGPREVLTWLALWATISVFTLKLLDVRFLRFRTWRGTALSFLLACAVAHHEVAVSDAGKAVIETTPAALVTSLVVGRLWQARRRWRDLWRWTFAGRTGRLVLARLHGIALAEAHRRPQWAVVALPCVPRAPPR